jgi:hypothetical protein
MSVNASVLKEAIERVLEVIKDYGDKLDKITTPERINISSGKYITIEWRPSSNSSMGIGMALTISYIVKDVGIPLEVRLNRDENYTRIILKSNREIKSYECFYTDPYGNIYQDKIIRPANITLLQKELESLYQSL